jgi:hypothetical protein
VIEGDVPQSVQRFDRFLRIYGGSIVLQLLMHLHLAIPVWIDLKAHIKIIQLQTIRLNYSRGNSFWSEDLSLVITFKRNGLHTMTDAMNQTEFPIQVDNESGLPEMVKWTIEKEKYKTTRPYLRRLKSVIYLHTVYRWCTRLRPRLEIMRRSWSSPTCKSSCAPFPYCWQPCGIRFLNNFLWMKNAWQLQHSSASFLWST